MSNYTEKPPYIKNIVVPDFELTDEIRDYWLQPERVNWYFLFQPITDAHIYKQEYIHRQHQIHQELWANYNKAETDYWREIETYTRTLYDSEAWLFSDGQEVHLSSFDPRKPHYIVRKSNPWLWSKEPRMFVTTIWYKYGSCDPTID
jgi:hypothetical protein